MANRNYKKLPNQKKLNHAFKYYNGKLFWKNPSKYKPKLRGKRAGHLNIYGYRVVSFEGVLYQEHRIIYKMVFGKNPKEDLDHKNGIKNDNKIQNIREASPFINNKNSKKRHDNKSGIAGVFFREDSKKWRAYINVDKKRIDLGSYKNKKNAISARKLFEKAKNFSDRHGK